MSGSCPREATRGAAAAHGSRGATTEELGTVCEEFEPSAEFSETNESSEEVQNESQPSMRGKTSLRGREHTAGET